MSKGYFEIVDGYVFRSREMADQARKELEGIRYVKKQIDTANPEAVLEVYNRMIQENLFHTVVGFSFLRELQEYLKCSPEIEDEFIRALEFKESAVQKEKMAQMMVEPIKNRLVTSYIIIGILSALIVGMIIIMKFSDNATILNYENKIIDRYEHWEKELEEREQAIKDKEKELDIQP